MGLDIVREVRGAMTRFDVLTPEHVTKFSEGNCTYEQLAADMAQMGLDIKKVVVDDTRVFQNAYYADYENGWYNEVYIQKGQHDYLLHLVTRIRNQGPKNPALIKKQWETYYYGSVPLAMSIYDFQFRYRDIDPDEVFEVWKDIHIRIDYANGMWDKEILNYVFSHAPKPELPPVDDDGLITIYRGTGALSQAPEDALSWSSDPCTALWFANRSARGTNLLIANIHPVDVVAYFPEKRNECEVVVRPGAKLQLVKSDMIPSTEAHVPMLLLPATQDFFRYGRIALSLGYPQEGRLQYHGINHILRVFLLSLVYYHNAEDNLTEEDKQILIYFSLLHDIGRVNEEIDNHHGDMSLEKIEHQNIRIKGLKLSRKAYRIANLLISYHCKDDDIGNAAIQAEPVFSRKDKERAAKLYAIAKDMDGLDRVRFNGLDYRQLRTPFAKRLPLVAGGLLDEKLVEVLQQAIDGKLEVPGFA